MFKHDRLSVTFSEYLSEEELSTLEGLRKAKAKLEQRLSAMVNKFTCDYGVSVDSIERVYAGKINSTHLRTEGDYTVKLNITL